VPPALFSTDEIGYITLFSSEMALVLAATLILTTLAARKLQGCGAWIVPALTFAAAAIMLYPVAVTRYYAVVALTVLCATLLGGRKLLVAHVFLGFGAAAKLVPALATVPLALARRGVSRGYAVFFAAVALFLVPALLVGGSGFLVSFAYHTYRGLQVESIAASVLMKLGRASGGVFEYDAFEVQGGGVDLVGSLSPAAIGTLLLVTAFFMYWEYRKGRFEPRTFPRYASALILAFMLGSKVLSPQYVIWLLPIVLLGVGEAAHIGVSVVFLAICWTSIQVYPSTTMTFLT
jgi:hypothetical protein